jgi:hypothetical protein
MDFIIINALKELDNRTKNNNPSRINELEAEMKVKDAQIASLQEQINTILIRLEDENR